MPDRVPVVIVGAGPAGLVLAHLLHLQGIESVVLERQTRHHVEHRLRAGVLEAPTVALLREVGLADRLDREALTHDGFHIRLDRRTHFVDCWSLAGLRATVYGQQELVKDLIAARLATGGAIEFAAEAVRIEGLDTDRPVVAYVADGATRSIRCDVVAGCDGFHGVSRASIPGGALTTYERSYPFAWLGILAHTKPAVAEGVYSVHEDGLAVHSMRGPDLTRQYLQVPADTSLDDWSDDRIWEALQRRASSDDTGELETGPIVERSLAPLRSFVVEPMQFGRLFLLGDAAHVMPPTGAKGLNLAVGDACVLSHAIGALAATGSTELLDAYSATALARVWLAQRFSWQLTTMLHRFDDLAPYDRRLARAELDHVLRVPAARAALAENYAGLPFPTPWSYA